MHPDEPCNGKTCFQRVSDESILKVERQSTHTKNSGGLDRLNIPRPSIGVSSRFPVTQVDEKRLQSFV
jgi:hypothetical protein